MLSTLSFLLFTTHALAQFAEGIGYVANATLGPSLELYHEFWDQWPTGLAVSKSGRIFINFPTQVSAADDFFNFTVGEVVSPTEEVAFPSVAFNRPPFFANSSDPTRGAGYSDYLISAQSVVIDPKDRLWILDTGRPLVAGQFLLASGFGPKLVGVDLTTNETFQTITFPPSVAYPDTYLNDVRFDLRPNITESGQGVAYITDSSDEGRNGIIVVDLGTGASWRHLDRDTSVTADRGFISAYDGTPFIVVHPPSYPYAPGTYSHFTTGSDGIALGSDGEWLYYSPLSSRRLYRVPTALLRIAPGPTNPSASNAAVAGVQFLGQHASHADGMETSDDGTIWIGAPEQDAIFQYNPVTGSLSSFVRDPRIQWPDTLSVGADGYLYFNSNQYYRQPTLNNGTDYRARPFGMLRAQLPNGAAKVTGLQ